MADAALFPWSMIAMRPGRDMYEVGRLHCFELVPDSTRNDVRVA